MILNFVNKYKTELIGIGLGSIAGFFYYYFVGCSSGKCAISSNPFVSVPYGGLMGYFISGFFKKD